MAGTRVKPIKRSIVASSVLLDTINFNQNLSDSDVNVQIAMDTIDNLILSSGGDILEINQDAHGFDDELVYFNGATWTKAIADSLDHCATHFARRVDDNNFQVYNAGEINISGLVNGNYYWLSQTVPGAFDIDQPLSGVSQSVLKANDTGQVTIIIDQPFVPGPLVEPDILIDGGEW